MFAASKTATSGTVPDSQFNYVTMLLHGDGTNGAQNNTFVDSSSNNFTITRNGNTTQGSFSPYGSNWGNYFLNTSNGNRIDWDFSGSPAENAVAGTNYTIEFWVFRLPKSGTYQTIFSTENDSNNFVVSGSNFQVTSNGGTQMFLINADTYVPLNTWTHVALTCSSTTWTLYFNGTSYGTYSGASKTSAGYGTAQLGGRGDMNGCGYLSNFRISTTSRYSGNFTPSTTPFVADGSTAMLTCQSNRFIDTSSNAQALRVNGTMSVQRFNPFGTSTAYSTSVIGGSGYFDGSGDYLSVADNTALELGSGDFTIEFWINTTISNGGYVSALSKWGTSNQSYMIRAASTDIGSGWSFFYSTDGSSYATVFGSAVNDGAWHHVAVTRSGNVFRTFTDGVLKNSATAAVTLFNGTDSVILGAQTGGSNPFTGYISDARIVKGTALYTATFTPNTSPLTAVSGTSLLTNFTNGAIYDNAMMNDLETVGNAQISTSVVKYGTGSLYFDGTGDYLQAPQSPSFAYGTGNFTIEFWAYPTSFSGYKTFYSGYLSASSAAGFELGINSSGYLYIYSGGGFAISASSSALSLNAWNHVAMVRNGSTITVYIDGVSKGTWSLTSQNFTDNYCVIGQTNTGPSQFFTGYLDDFRITKGYARYTTTFTPPTAAFPNTGPY